ncbi:MAG: 3-phosphoshikimate 1-carboxyvinyltransferase [Bacteroidetes bacterium]|nr:3-phosphoshikimate 1-carboxyvinyltransferase [Bacteroidota bacterium]
MPSTHLHISRQSTVSGVIQSLPSSKSVSNRALLIDALTNFRCNLLHLSSARDTKLMHELIRSTDTVINVKDAGTTMRFLTAYFGVTGQHRVLTGTDRMKERPIRLLVDALRSIGVDISYQGKEGFPPIEVKGFNTQASEEVNIRGDISSQYISALMMIAPALPKGLTICLEGKVGSKPYLEMTAALMGHFGVTPDFRDTTIRIDPAAYQPRSYRIESDWSAISYWYAVAALATEADLFLPDVVAEALQGDRVITDIMQPLGVKSIFENGGLRLQHQSITTKSIKLDFTDCPDLAQTILPVCSVLGVKGEFTGLESLRIKETDRIAALQAELKKIGAALEETTVGWSLVPGKGGDQQLFVHTYHDHRMAMGFAPLATRMDVIIEDPDVVQKSYPAFWEDLGAVGFRIRSEES